MLMIGIPKSELAALDAAGTPAKINFRPVTLRRRGDYLQYADASGKENKCRILDSFTEGDQVMFFAASDGGEGAHVILRPEA